MRTFARLLTLVATLLVGAQAPVSAQKAIDLDSATIAELNAAFKAGTPDRREAGADVPGADPGLRPARPAPSAR